MTAIYASPSVRKAISQYDEDDGLTGERSWGTIHVANGHTRQAAYPKFVAGARG